MINLPLNVPFGAPKYFTNGNIVSALDCPELSLPSVISVSKSDLRRLWSGRVIEGVRIFMKFPLTLLTCQNEIKFMHADPLGFLDGADESQCKRFREAELTHGRVSMLAFLGFLIGEKVEGSSFLFDSQISGPAINHFAQVPSPFWEVLVLAIGVAEVFRAQVGWVSPLDSDEKFLLRDDYTPGDIGFDPLGLRPEDPEEFEAMQTKELQHCRLAMLAAAGFVAQELVDGQTIIQHLTGAVQA